MHCVSCNHELSLFQCSVFKAVIMEDTLVTVW